jgi:hypothetical protein
LLHFLRFLLFSSKLAWANEWLWLGFDSFAFLFSLLFDKLLLLLLHFTMLFILVLLTYLVFFAQQPISLGLSLLQLVLGL